MLYVFCFRWKRSFRYGIIRWKIEGDDIIKIKMLVALTLDIFRFISGVDR